MYLATPDLRRERHRPGLNIMVPTWNRLPGEVQKRSRCCYGLVGAIDNRSRNLDAKLPHHLRILKIRTHPHRDLTTTPWIPFEQPLSLHHPRRERTDELCHLSLAEEKEHGQCDPTGLFRAQLVDSEHHRVDQCTFRRPRRRHHHIFANIGRPDIHFIELCPRQWPMLLCLLSRLIPCHESSGSISFRRRCLDGRDQLIPLPPYLKPFNRRVADRPYRYKKQGIHSTVT